MTTSEHLCTLVPTHHLQLHLLSIISVLASKLIACSYQIRKTIVQKNLKSLLVVTQNIQFENPSKLNMLTTLYTLTNKQHNTATLTHK